jgi:hypothetical protein
MGDTFSKTIFHMNHQFFFKEFSFLGKSGFDTKLQRYFNQYLNNCDGLEKMN